jgi:hypothetical protein
VHKGSLAQVTLTSLALLSQQVALKSLITTDLARTGHFECLLCTAVRLHLGHVASVNFFKDGKSRHITAKRKKKNPGIYIARLAGTISAAISNRFYSISNQYLSKKNGPYQQAYRSNIRYSTPFISLSSAVPYSNASTISFLY